MHAAPAQQSCSLLGSSILCCCPRASAPSLSPLVPISPHHDHRLMIITVIIIFVSPALASFLPLLSHSIPSSSLLARLSRSLSSREQHRQHARSQSVKEGERERERERLECCRRSRRRRLVSCSPNQEIARWIHQSCRLSLPRLFTPSLSLTSLLSPLSLSLSRV